MARITLGAERFDTEASGPEYRGLESGDIVFFPVSPPLLPDEDRAFLVTQKQTDASYHKNISYRPIEDRLKGVDQDDATERARVHEIMRGYSQRAITFMSTLLNRYAGKELEDRLRELPADHGIGPPGCPAFPQRPVAFRFFSDAAVARRPIVADFHQYPPGSGKGLAHHGPLRSAGRPVRGAGRVASQARRIRPLEAPDGAGRG